MTSAPPLALQPLKLPCFTLEQEAARDLRVSIELPYLPADAIPGMGWGEQRHSWLGDPTWAAHAGQQSRPQQGWIRAGMGQGAEVGLGVCAGTHSFWKVLTAMSAPWGTTFSVVASPP